MNDESSTPIPLYGTLLTYGNRSEFPLIRAQLKQKNINWKEFHFNGSVIFYFDETQLDKLPIDEVPDKVKQYLPVDEEAGHSIYRVEKMLERYRIDYPDVKEQSYEAKIIETKTTP